MASAYSATGGILLPQSPFGHVDQAIGKNIARGTSGLIAPTISIVEDVEELVFGLTRGVEIDRPYQIKRELIEFRRCVSPLCSPLAQLAAHDLKLVPDDARPYFRDLSDLVQEVRENIHTMEDQLTNILQAALAMAAVTDNRDMRKISAAVAILAVPTTLGAVYGMNFDNIPELHWQYGYFALMVVNVGLMITLYLIFRKIRWL